MRSFSKQELVVVTVILAIIAIVSFVNFGTSLRRARDAQRKSDLGSISRALEKYQGLYGFFPPSSDDGRIIACFDEPLIMETPESFSENIKGDKFVYEDFFNLQRACGWGEDGLLDPVAPEPEAILDVFPQDPLHAKGLTYLYISNARRYQLLAYLEGGSEEDEYSVGVLERELNCGVKLCNMGLGYASTPVDITLEEHERRIAK